MPEKKRTFHSFEELARSFGVEPPEKTTPEFAGTVKIYPRHHTRRRSPKIIPKNPPRAVESNPDKPEKQTKKPEPKIVRAPLAKIVRLDDSPRHQEALPQERPDKYTLAWFERMVDNPRSTIQKGALQREPRGGSDPHSRWMTPVELPKRLDSSSYPSGPVKALFPEKYVSEALQEGADCFIRIIAQKAYHLDASHKSVGFRDPRYPDETLVFAKPLAMIEPQTGELLIINREE